MTEGLDQLAADWAALIASTALRDLKTPTLTSVRLSLNPENIPGRADVERAVAEMETSWTGWLRRESDAYRTPQTKARAKAGAPLDGEWVSPDGLTSVRLLHDGWTWRLITISEGRPEGQPALREDAALLAGDGGPGPLTYAVYWGSPEIYAPVTRLASRFTGFGEKV